MKIRDDMARLKVFCDSPFKGLCTPAEFAEIFGVDESAVRHAIKNGRIRPGIDCFKFGKQWVLNEQAFQNFSKNGTFEKVSQLRTVYAKIQAEKNTVT